MSFRQKKYSVIRNALTPEMVKYVKIMCEMQEQACLYMVQPSDEVPYPFGDSQTPNSFASYGSILSDSLASYFREKISFITGKNLVETYSYWRVYYNGAILDRHTDRPSCEYSGTICIKKDSDWPIYFEDLEKKEIKVDMEEGDMIVYKGDVLSHWRDLYEGDRHIQIFVHYVDSNGPYKENLYDGREVLGLPAEYKKPLIHN